MSKGCLFTNYNYDFQAQIILRLCDSTYTRMGTPARLVEALKTMTLVDQSIIAFFEDPMSMSAAGPTALDQK